jgi:hypothetical protein
VLIALGIVCLLLIGFFVWTRLFGFGQPATGGLIELWDAYEDALGAAQGAADDAQLVSASASWQAASEDGLLAGSSNWAFRFYSPASRQVFDVGANAETAWVALETRVWHTPDHLEEGSWSEGPKDALLVFLAYGGREFIESHSQAMVDVHLSAQEGGEATWSITVLEGDSQDVLSLLIDAESMQVLEISP